METEPQAWQKFFRPSVLLVAVDDLYRDSVVEALKARDFDVHGLPDGAAFVSSLDIAAKANVLLLDWTLPGLSGIELLLRLRKAGINVPVVFLTTRPEVDDEHAAFDNGAVDFIDKARGIDVLVKRLAVVLQAHREAHRPSSDVSRLYGRLALRPASGRAEWRRQDVGLTLSEYKVVDMLASAAGDTCTYRALYERIRNASFRAGRGDLGYRVNVRGLVRKIRKKFLALDPAFAAIVAREGVGYCWREQHLQDVSVLTAAGVR
jgi:two-component system, OmpR family, response regulator ChvI